MKKKKKKLVKMNFYMDEDICQNCECANVCKIYNDIHSVISPFDDNTKNPYIRIKITECSFYKKIN